MRTHWAAAWCCLVMVLPGCSLTGGDSALADPAAPSAAAPSTPAGAAADRLPRAEDAQQVTVVRIVDGDTLRVTVPPGVASHPDAPVRAGAETVVRLLEIDTPETNGRDHVDECYAAESTHELARLVPVGSAAWVSADRELLDRYDRTLLYVWNADGEFLNEAMVEGGYARAVLFRPNDLHIERLRAAERRAVREGAGLWSACPPAR